MKLISCYITGFGTIKEYGCSFSDGLTAVCRENGWGKTSFCAFLKAMFYGMEYSARSKALNDRKHYLPWDGGVCGGSVVFEADGKVYRLERTFGKSDKADTFCLYDDTTGKASDAYSEKIGEELFEVDRESFERSIFIPQAAPETAMTDSLNAKMGDLAAAKDDINNFDAALGRVQEAKKSYLRKSAVNNGRLNVIRDEIRSCAEVIDKKEAILNGFEIQTRQQEKNKDRLKEMEKEKSGIAERIRRQSLMEQERGAYRKQKEFLEKQQEEASRLDDFFAAGIPEDGEQEAVEETERQYDMNCRAEKELMAKIPDEAQIGRWEELFADGVPAKSETELWNEKAQRIQELQIQGKHAKLSEDTEKQIEEYRRFFSEKQPTEEELAQVEKDAMELSRLEGRMVELSDRYRNLKARREVAEEQDENRGNGVVILLAVLALALAAGGFAFRFLTPGSSVNTSLQIACFGGAALVLSFLVMHLLRVRTTRENRRREIARQAEELSESLRQCEEEKNAAADRCGAFLSHFRMTPGGSMQQMIYEIRVHLEKYRHLQEEEEKSTEQTTEAVEELSDIRMELYTLLGHYAECYGMDLYHEGCETTLLERLNKDMEAYEEYAYHKTQYELLQATKKQQKMQIDGYLSRFPLDRTLPPSENLKVIADDLKRYGRLQEEIAASQKEIEAFEGMEEAEEESVPVEELQARQAQIDDQIREVNQELVKDGERLAQLSEELEAVEEAERRRDVLMEEQRECGKKVELLEKTEHYLQIARERFLSVYMEPLHKGMERYMSMLDGGSSASLGMEIDITMDLSVQVRSNGNTRSGEYLSRGYQDLAALCARFALVDVLYHKEQPMIVLDDPFTNLDIDKIGRGLELLQEIASDRQILYFTCHQSRMPEGNYTEILPA